MYKILFDQQNPILFFHFIQRGYNNLLDWSYLILASIKQKPHKNMKIRGRFKSIFETDPLCDAHTILQYTYIISSSHTAHLQSTYDILK